MMTKNQYLSLYDDAINERVDWLTFLKNLPTNKRLFSSLIDSKLKAALKEKNYKHIELLVKMALVDGPDNIFIEVLCKILEEEWTAITNHEDIIDLLFDIGSKKSIKTLNNSLSKKVSHDPFNSVNKKLTQTLEKLRKI